MRQTNKQGRGGTTVTSNTGFWLFSSPQGKRLGVFLLTLVTVVSQFPLRLSVVEGGSCCAPAMAPPPAPGSTPLPKTQSGSTKAVFWISRYINRTGVWRGVFHLLLPQGPFCFHGRQGERVTTPQISRIRNIRFVSIGGVQGRGQVQPSDPPTSMKAKGGKYCVSKLHILYEAYN